MPTSTFRSNTFHFSNPLREQAEEDEKPKFTGNNTMPERPSGGACTHCKSLKVKCDFTPGERVCQRCHAGGHECIPRSRKKRKPAETQEQLVEKSLEQDRQIQEILLQLEQKKEELKIHDRMMRVPIAEVAPVQDYRDPLNRLIRPARVIKQESAEAAARIFYGDGNNMSSPGLTVPDIIKHCSLQPPEIQELFNLFFERINTYFSILDPELHTPRNLIWTCPFLFTVICAVASRFYEKRPGLYLAAMEFARDCAGRALIDGSRSVDVCQAYLLMAVYPVPKKKWVEDRSWLLMGVAIRMAMELQLHEPPPDSCDERERLNRMRTWFNCYCVDGSHAIQFGKLPMLRLDDYLARQSRDWYKSSALNLPTDVHLVAYVPIIMIVAEWRAKMLDLFRSTEPPSISEIVDQALQTQEKLRQEMAKWQVAYDRELELHPLEICRYRGNTTQLITSYLRLVVLAVPFERIPPSTLTRDSALASQAIQSARDVIRIMVTRLRPTGFLRYALEAHFVFVSFAAAFLINLLRPKFAHVLDEHLQDSIIDEVERLIEVLRSKDVALDGRHTPHLHSRFLRSLLGERSGRSARFESSSPSNEYPPMDVQIPGNDDPGSSMMPGAYSWPDISHLPPQAPIHTPAYGFDYNNGVTPEMDLSLSHFVRTVSSQNIEANNFQFNPPHDWTSNLPEQPAQFTDFWNTMGEGQFSVPQHQWGWAENRG